MAGLRYRNMKKSVLMLVVMLVAGTASGQLHTRTEFGGGIGAMTYTGDLARTYNLDYARPAITVFYRNNLSSVVSLRTSLTFGSVKGGDKPNPIDPAALVRDERFKVSLTEFSPVFEYHFLDWRSGRRPIRFTPYLFAGGGIFIFSGNKAKPAEYSNVQMCIPFGGGGKVVLNPYWYIAMEFGIRKTFFDYLDNVSDGDTAFKNYRYGNPYDKDNYFFAGITLTRTFYEIPCPSSPYR